jgi:small subunit ribosomal protein S24e
MKIDILEERENKLLGRREIKFKIVHEGPTPPRNEVREKLIAMLGAKPDAFILKSYRSRFGGGVSVGTCRVYSSKEKALEIESKPLLIKNGILPKEEG